jgi:protein TonB
LKREAAMIDEKIQDYQQRPRKAFVGPTTKQYPMAQYIEEWRTKIEEYGNKHYPDNLKGRFYGQVVISVNIRHDGKLLDITIDESSNNPEIDKAAVALIRKNAPFASFSRKLADELVIPRTWRFTRNGLLSEDINSRLTVAP